MQKEFSNEKYIKKNIKKQEPKKSFDEMVEEVLYNVSYSWWDRYLKFKHEGNCKKALCPFHDENNASFTVTKKKPYVFNCFGCGKAGNAIQFLQEYEKLDFWEALRRVAEENQCLHIVEEYEKERKKYSEYKKECEKIRKEWKEIWQKQASEIKKEIEQIQKQIQQNKNKETSEYKEVYQYKDMRGNFLYEKVRVEKYDIHGNRIDKTFYFQNRKIEHNVLFGLENFDPNKPILVFVEGEKDCLTLKKLNSDIYNILSYNAFRNDIINTIRMHTGLIKYLKQMQILFTEDNDEKGYKNTTEIVYVLKELGIYRTGCIQFHKYTKGYDISDYLINFNDFEKLKRFDQLCINAADIIVLTPTNLQQFTYIYKYTRNVIIANSQSIFSPCINPRAKNIIIFDDDILNFKLDEIESIFEDATVYVDKYMYLSLRKFPLLKLSFVTQKMYTFDNNNSVREIYDKEKRVTEINISEFNQKVQKLVKQLEESEEKEKILAEIASAQKAELFDETMQIPRASIGIITGLGESGKTTFVCLYSIFLAIKKKINIAIITLEESRRYIERRINNALTSLCLSNPLEIEKIKQKIKIYSASPREIKTLTDFCLRKNDIVFIDNLSYLLHNENDNSEAAIFFGFFNQLVENTQKNILFLHHANKGFISDYVQNAKNLEDLKLLSKKNATRGASAILNNVRCVFLILTDSLQDHYILTIKNNLAQHVCYKIKKFYICYENWIEKIKKYVEGEWENCTVEDFFVAAEPVLHAVNKAVNKKITSKKRKDVPDISF